MMKRTLSALGFALFATAVHAASPQAAAETTVAQALSCEQRGSKVRNVLKALKTLGAKPGKLEGEFSLPAPITVFGLPVSSVVVTESDGASPDTYFSVFPGGNLNEIVATVRLKPIAGGKAFRRDGKAGTLDASVMNGRDVMVSCTMH